MMNKVKKKILRCFKFKMLLEFGVKRTNEGQLVLDLCFLSLGLVP